MSVELAETLIFEKPGWWDSEKYKGFEISPGTLSYFWAEGRAFVRIDEVALNPDESLNKLHEWHNYWVGEWNSDNAMKKLDEAWGLEPVS